MIGRDKDADLGTSPVERVVHQLLRNLGELLPETAADVAASEKLVTGGPEELPPGLRDAKSVLERKVNLSLPPSNNGCAGVDLDVLRGLQAAARNGSLSPEELEKRIEADWNDDEDDAPR